MGNRMKASRIAGSTGEVKMYAGSTAPEGWLECNGSLLSKDSYSNLFNIIGTVYGETGNGFNLPDLRGRFIRGWDNGAGVDSQRTFGSYQADALQNITGSFGNVGHGTTGTAPTGALYDASVPTANGGYNGAAGGPLTIAFDASRVARTSTETRPKNVAMLYIIKY